MLHKSNEKAHERFPSVFRAPDSDKPAAAGGVQKEPETAPGAFEAPETGGTTFGGIKQRGAPSRADKIALGQLKGGGATSTSRSSPLNWSIYTVAELVKFRDEITEALPSLQLKSLDMEQEMLLQYHVLRSLQNDVIDDGETPVNQRAQVANSVASTLRTLSDQQVALYSSERFKDIENLLIRTLDKLPEDLAASFLVEYERLLLKHEKK